MKRTNQKRSDAEWLRNIILDNEVDNDRLSKVADRLEALDEEVIPALEAAEQRLNDALTLVLIALVKVKP